MRHRRSMAISFHQVSPPLHVRDRANKASRRSNLDYPDSGRWRYHTPLASSSDAGSDFFRSQFNDLPYHGPWLPIKSVSRRSMYESLERTLLFWNDKKNLMLYVSSRANE